MKRSFLTLFLFSILLLFCETKEEFFQKFDQLIDSYEYTTAETILTEKINTAPNMKLESIQKLYSLYELTGQSEKWSRFISSLIKEEEKNMAVVNQIVRICGEDKNYNDLLPIFNYMMKNGIQLIDKNKNYVFQMIANTKDKNTFYINLNKLLKNRNISSRVRISYLQFISMEEKEKYFSFFPQNDIFFKGFLLTYYHKDNKSRFNALFERIRRENFNARCVYSQFLFSIGEYGLVIELLETGIYAKRYPYQEVSTLIDSYILLQKYENIAKLLMSKYYRSYVFSYIYRLESTFAPKEVFKTLAESIIRNKKMFSSQTIVKIACLSEDKSLLRRTIDYTYTRSQGKDFNSLFSINFYHLDKKIYVEELIDYLVNKEDVKINRLIPILQILERFGRSYGTIILKLSEKIVKIDPTKKNLNNYYLMLYGSKPFDQIVIDDNDNSHYASYLHELRNFKTGIYGKMKSRNSHYKELYQLDKWFVKGKISDNEILSCLNKNSVYSFGFSPILHYFIINKDIDEQKRMYILKKYAEITYFNENDDTRKDEEIYTFLSIYYYNKIGNLSKARGIFDKNKSKLDFFKDICMSMCSER
jgi:hypothetical protein